MKPYQVKLYQKLLLVLLSALVFLAVAGFVAPPDVTPFRAILVYFNADIDGNLDVDGASTFDGAAEFNGAANFDGAVDFDGATNFSGATVSGLGEYYATDESGNTAVTGTLTVSNTALFTSAVTALAGLDLNGTELALDADGNTTLTADTDNQIDVKINNADDFAFKANSFELVTGSIVDLNAAADALALDTDGNTSISAPTDNQIDIEVNGADDFQITANTFTALSGSTIKADTVAETTSANGVAVDGVILKDAGVNLGTAGVLDIPVNVEHLGVMSIITATVPYSPATGTVATIADGEIWLVHSVFVQTNTNFDCTGNDCTLEIGDSNDPNGFTSANDAALQAAFTEATGYAAGFYGIEAGSGGAYTLDDGGPFVYAPSGAPETIDYAVGGTDPAAGSATAYIIYTRIQ